jgi:hypothetical protein
MYSSSKKRPFDDDDDQGSFSTPPPLPKRQKLGDNGGDVDSDSMLGVPDKSEPELTLESGDNEPFTLDSEDRKLEKPSGL